MDQHTRLHAVGKVRNNRIYLSFTELIQGPESEFNNNSISFRFLIQEVDFCIDKSRGFFYERIFVST